MFRYLHLLLDSRGLAPHGFCLLWVPELIWTHVIADAVTALAYFTIPVALIMLVRKRGDIQFSWLFVCFALFILACGAAHIMSIVTLWVPLYGIQALVKAVMAVVSVATAAAFWPLMPKLLAIPSPTQLRLANEALAERIAERDGAILRLEAEIEERQKVEAMLEAQSRELELAHAAAESASQAKSHFLANMSHELRTPLNAVMGYAQLLGHDATLGERQHHAARTIHDSGEHLLTLINDILDLSKIEAGKFELYPASTDLRGFLKGLAAIMQVRTDEKALQFHCELAPELPDFVLADEKRLRQVLLNLLGNAVKFTDRGCVSLEVSVLVRDAGSVRLNFAVRDSGVGMSAEQLPLIFRPFEQVGDNQKRLGGTGLGLSITRQLVGLMGGEIRVESTLGQGSLFWFDLELAVAHGSATVATPALCTGYEGARRRVLVVDDNAANRDVLATMLTGLGFEVVREDGANAGLQAAQETAFDLVLMDIRMPGKDGLEAIGSLRADPRTAAVPIIAVSSGVTPADQARTIEAGAGWFLPKPLDRDELIRLVGEATGVIWILGEAAAAEADAGTALPDRAAIEALHGVAQTGNMRAVRQEAERIAGLDPAFRGFTDTVVRLARAFQSQALLALIESKLEARA